MSRIDWPATIVRWAIFLSGALFWAGVVSGVMSLRNAFRHSSIDFTTTCHDLIQHGWAVEQSTCVQAFLSAL